MKKFVLMILVGAAILAWQPVAQADNYPFESSVVQTGDLGANTVYQRYYTEASNVINGNCSSACASAGLICERNVEDNQDYCRLIYGAKQTGGYRGYGENIFNFADQPYGSVMNSLFDYQRNAGSANHQGFYAWTRGPVNNNAQSQWNSTTPATPGQTGDCNGTVLTACLGNGAIYNAKSVTRVPSSSGGPTIANIGGFSPIPVPRAGAGAPAGVFRLEWDAAKSVGKVADVNPAGFDIYRAKAANCGTPPNETQFTFVKTVPGSVLTADVTAAEAGFAPGEQGGVTFALKVRFPSAAGTAMTTRFLSANGQCFLNGGLSANVYELVAKYAGKNNVEVTWKTSLEDGVRGFYVSRSTTQNGPYSRISELIPAKGEASAYSFIDTIQMPAGPTKASGLWYKVETIDIDDNAVEFGPAKAQLPNQGSNIIKQRTAKPQR